MPARAALLALVALGAAGVCAPARAADEDMSLGSADAKVTVVEFASPTCPHCMMWDQDVWPAFKARYVDTGQVRFVLREMPVHGAIDVAAFLVARCAPKERYFDVLRQITQAEPQYMDQMGQGDSSAYRNVLFEAGRSAGLDDKAIKACMSDSWKAEALEARTDQEAAAADVGSVPTFLVNGQKLDTSHPATLDELDAAIRAAAKGRN